MSVNSPQFAPNMMYYSPSAVKKRKAGATIFGGLLGMTAYYLPVTKDEFVNKAFKVTKAEANSKILSLTKAAKEIEKNSLSTESKMVLQEMGLNADIKEITKRCIDIDATVSNPQNVSTYKTYFNDNFKIFKKNPHLMDNNCADAFKSLKWNKFKWGMGIGAALGLAFSLMSSRD